MQQQPTSLRECACSINYFAAQVASNIRQETATFIFAGLIFSFCI